MAEGDEYLFTPNEWCTLYIDNGTPGVPSAQSPTTYTAKVVSNAPIQVRIVGINHIPITFPENWHDYEFESRYTRGERIRDEDLETKNETIYTIERISREPFEVRTYETIWIWTGDPNDRIHEGFGLRRRRNPMFGGALQQKKYLYVTRKILTERKCFQFMRSPQQEMQQRQQLILCNKKKQQADNNEFCALVVVASVAVGLALLKFSREHLGGGKNTKRKRRTHKKAYKR